jgi:hypothetical protein
VTGDSPYRRPERPAQLVTDDAVTAHVDRLIDAEIVRRLRAYRRARRLRQLRTAGVYLAAPVIGPALAVLWLDGHETFVLWTLLITFAALGTWGLLHLIANIPTGHDPPS